MLGCDYCDSIGGVGPKTALKLIREHKTIESILEHIRGEKKYKIPDDWIPNEKRQEEKEKMKEEDYNTEDETDKIKNFKDDERKEDEEEEELIPIYIEARKLFMHHEVLEGKYSIKNGDT